MTQGRRNKRAETSSRM